MEARVIDLGTADYIPTLEAMRSMRTERRKGVVPDTLLLVEHPSVITVGVQGADGGGFPPGIPVIPVERGGKATWHGPGQLVGYPVVDLEPRGRDVHRYVADVEELLLRALRPFDISAQRLPGRRGIWTEGQRKIASIGIAVQEWVTFHGFALNVSNSLDAFRLFQPCGFEGAVMTTVSKEVGHPVSVEEVKPHVVGAWRAIFGRDPDSGSPTTGVAASSGPA